MVPPVHPPCPPTRLSLIARVTRRDQLLIPRILPALTGTGPESLACGKCSGLIVSGLTCRTARREHPEGSRLVIRCTCGALNLLSSERGS
jgi:RNase P subunit RPR2